MNLGLQNKIALVTGAGRGIGRAIALALAAEGCRVAICDLNIASQTEDIFSIQADVTKPDDVRRVVDAVVEKWGGLDILVNNVGGGGGREPRPVEEVPEAKWLETMDRNAFAAVRFTRLAIPHMRRAKWGRVITIASTAGKEGGGRPWYTMAKSAEIAMMKSLALNKDLVRDGLTFNSVAPGRIIFPGNEWDQFRQEDPPRFEQTLKARLPLGRCGTPEEIAAIVVFACSTNASFLNGACIAVDGGESYSF